MATQTNQIAQVKEIIRHIKPLPIAAQRLYLDFVDMNGRNALILAAYHGFNHIFTELRKLRFNLAAIDRDGHSALAYLLIKNAPENLIEPIVNKLTRFNAIESALLRSKIALFNLASVDQRKSFARLLTNQKPMIQLGSIPKVAATETRRPRRSFSQERERQLLKRVATQLYFAFKNNKKTSSVTEVQLMHVMYGTKHYLFIAANPAAMNQHMIGLFSAPDSLRDLLTQAYQPVRDTEGKRRSKRYAHKLGRHIFTGVMPASTLPQDATQMGHSTRVLRANNIYSQEIQSSTVDATITAILADAQLNDATIFLNWQHPSHSLRHAEEFLTDVAESFNALGRVSGTPVYTCIAGKKRPCAGCAGRMQGHISQYGQHNGNFWLNSIESQSEEAAKRTFNVLLSNPSYVSVSANGLDAPGYDTGSDSDDDGVALAR